MSRLDGGSPRRAKPAASVLAREPIVVGNLVGVLVLNVCALLQQFGVPLTEGQQEAVTTVVGTLVLLSTALLARRFTTPLVRPRDRLGRPLVTKTSPRARGGFPAGPDYPNGG